VFLVLGVALVRRARGHWGEIAALAVFAFAGVFLLSMSGVYHLLSPHGAGRVVLQRLDHAAIFFMIAGTMTAVQALLFRGVWQWGVIIVLWVTTATAITLKTIFFADVPESLSLAMYLGLGWIGAVSGWRIHRRFGWAFIRPLVYGALAYSVGAVLEYMRQPVLIPGVVGPHELFHVAVLAGLGWHWRFLYDLAAPTPGSPRLR
jgi:channel protein (hemolysin III family)